MKYTLETKFDIGDTVYIADHYYDYYASHTPYVVTGITVKINHNGTYIAYYVEHGENTDYLPETFIFSTYDECVKWCDEHN